MQDKLQGTESTPAVTERRACPRLRVTSLIYIDIANVNGGIVTSLSENGLALTAAATLGNGESGEGPLRMRIQFPGIAEAIEASGEIVWTSSSAKEARLRFVELEEKAREQIRRWISDQGSANGLRPEPPKLPKMRLPNSPGAKARGARVSFSDVASARVDSEDKADFEDFRATTGGLGELPPLQAGGAGVRDAAQAVASAFESSVFTEDPTERPRPTNNPRANRATPEERLQGQPSSSIPERRQHPRRQILLFTYAVLGEDNGGLVFNLGEGGLALTAAAALQEQHLKKMRVRFPDSEDWIETSGRLAWMNGSGKEAGIEFVGLSEEARARIGEWVSQGAYDLALKEDEARASKSNVPELPSFMEPESFSAEPMETPASFEEQPFEDQAFEELPFEKRASAFAASSSALSRAGIKGVLERAAITRRVAKIKPPRLAGHTERQRTRVASKALSIAAGVVLSIGGWVLLQRTSLNEAGGVIAQNVPNPPSSYDLAQKPAAGRTEAGEGGATEDARVQPTENAASQTGIASPSVQQTDNKSSPPDTAKTTLASVDLGPVHASKEKPHGEAAGVKMPATSSAARSSDRPQLIQLTPREQKTKPPQITASVPVPSSDSRLLENKVDNKSAQPLPAENKPVQTAQALPTLNPNKDANTMPPTLNSNSPQPVSVPPVNLVKEKTSLEPKQPEAPLTRTPVVTVSFDPYPSIRMPKAEKSKKSQQGKSLQMGRLIARVDPAYPEEAKQQGIEGTVSLHAIFNREGAVQSVISVSGPPSLVPAAMNAVRQWRYSQTILGGQAVETEEDVTMLFRLANSASKN